MNETASLESLKKILYRLLTFICVAGLLVATFYVLGKVQLAVTVLIGSCLVVLVFHKPVDWLEARHIRRGFAVLISYLLIIAVLVGIAAIVYPMFREQFLALVTATPDLVTSIVAWVQELVNRISERVDAATLQSWIDSASSSLSEYATRLASQSATGLIDFSRSAVNVFLVFFFSLVVGFWFLLDYHKIAEEFHTIEGPRYMETVCDVLYISGRSFGGYLKGIIVASVCTGIIAWILFMILGLPYAGVLGFITGCMNIIPVVGPWIGGAVSAAVGLSVSPFLCIASIVAAFAAQQITDTFITPKVMSTTANLHPALVIIALTAGMSIGGLAGMVLSVPLFAAAKNLFAYFFEKGTGRELVTEDGAIFKGQNDRRTSTRNERTAGQMHAGGAEATSRADAVDASASAPSEKAPTVPADAADATPVGAVADAGRSHEGSGTDASRTSESDTNALQEPPVKQ